MFENKAELNKRFKPNNEKDLFKTKGPMNISGKKTQKKMTKNYVFFPLIKFKILLICWILIFY